MLRTKIMLVDDNDQLRGILKEYFQRQDDIEVVGEAADGESALQILENAEVDVMILDIIIPYMDGFSVLERIKAIDSNKRPKVIMLSALGQEEIIRRCCNLDAKYYMVKPFDLSVLHKRIQTVAGIENNTFPPSKNNAVPVRSTEVHSLNEKITSIFLMIGIPAHIKGYHFLREAIRTVIDTPEIINKITKELYPGIAKKFETSSSKVERAIRHAIEVAWTRGKIENLNSIFGYNIYSSNDKPTNGEFIALIADRMRLESPA